MISINSVNSVTKKIKKFAVFESTISCVRDGDNTAAPQRHG